LRENAGLTTRDGARRTGFSQAKLSRGGVNVPTEADALALTDLYGPPAEVSGRLRQFETLATSAVYGDDSREVLTRVAREYRKG